MRGPCLPRRPAVTLLTGSMRARGSDCTFMHAAAAQRTGDMPRVTMCAQQQGEPIPHPMPSTAQTVFCARWQTLGQAACRPWGSWRGEPGQGRHQRNACAAGGCRALRAWPPLSQSSQAPGARVKNRDAGAGQPRAPPLSADPSLGEAPAAGSAAWARGACRAALPSAGSAQRLIRGALPPSAAAAGPRAGGQAPHGAAARTPAVSQLGCAAGSRAQQGGAAVVLLWQAQPLCASGAPPAWCTD
jgi:hypothetical protein